MYQLLLKDGSKTGQYSPNSSPAKTAEKISREIYESEDMTGTQTFKFQFVKNRVKAEGGDKLYSFQATVKPLSRTAANRINVGGRSFYKKYDIKVKNLMRN